jgi:ATP-dependent HslUV protease ATP-binding subunit HslU
VSEPRSFTPREIVSELDRYIVGQRDAKRAVAVALRNRWRRRRVPEELRDEIAPKNIILIGPTGVGKTEIARRLARLAQAPFLKVEASKFTEVGYVGRDVESIVRDLVELAIAMVNAEEQRAVQAKAEERAEERVLDALLGVRAPAPGFDPSRPPGESRESLRRQLRQGALDDREIEVELADARGFPTMSIFGPQGVEEMGVQFKDLLGGLMPQRTRRKRLKLPAAKAAFVAEEAARLVDADRVRELAVERAEQTGIVFIDELDKVASPGGARHGPDVSREGVQRDLLPIVEGSTVQTKHGPVRTDHVLFIAAGAFHVAKPSDLIPELQGRFPIRVELASLGQEDFVKILTEPRNSLVRQYGALLLTEGVRLEFEESGVRTIAEIAARVNERTDDIGARRLHTVLERLLEEASFEAPDLGGAELRIDEAFVRGRLESLVKDEDLSRYIL